MKRMVVVLLVASLAVFAFAQESTGFGLKAFVAGGVVEPGLVGTSIGSYTGNAISTGFDVKLGARKPLADFFELPEYLPISAQVGLGFQMNSAKYFTTENLMAITLNIDAVYGLNEVVDIPFVDVSPFLGLKYDAQIYESFMASMLGLQLGAIVGYDFSDLIVEGLGLELILASTFDFDLSGSVLPVYTSQAYVNLGVTYAFEF